MGGNVERRLAAAGLTLPEPNLPLLKIELNDEESLNAIRANRSATPLARLIVDPN